MSLFQHILVHTTIYFCFQCHRTNSKLNAEDLVWFEEPDTKFKTLNVPQRNIFKERGCHNVTDIVWFQDPDLGHYNTEQFHPSEESIEETEEVASEENHWEMEDELFSNYFFANKWK